MGSAFYPALEVENAELDRLLVILDDHSPTGVQENGSTFTIFFSSSAHRDRGRDALRRELPAAIVSAREVDDEDWARRSQENLGPITVGRITIFPNPRSLLPNPQSIVIAPSMGFGTGHHATTRLCLAALQQLELGGSAVLDVGTGSGVLAIAARRLGATRALGIDNDADAVRSANENLSLNPNVDHVRFEIADLSRSRLPESDVVVANLTGSQLARSAILLVQALRPKGALIVSGLLAPERLGVAKAFDDLKLMSEASEDEWVCLTLVRSA